MMREREREVLVFFEERERGILREKRGDLVAVCAERWERDPRCSSPRLE